ncbi:MAG TPA: 2TM domain-containing protein [Chloroflexia bacterium]|nr:2TM domain-containing protein [Chloroflexia bacterium]
MRKLDSNSPEYYSAYQVAAKRVKDKMEFYQHLTSYVVVMAILTVIYLLTSWQSGELGYPWVIWPALGWGIAILFHFLGVFVFPDTPERRQRLVEAEMRRTGAAMPPYQAYPTSSPPAAPPYSELPLDYTVKPAEPEQPELTPSGSINKQPLG